MRTCIFLVAFSLASCGCSISSTGPVADGGPGGGGTFDGGGGGPFDGGGGGTFDGGWNAPTCQNFCQQALVNCDASRWVQGPMYLDNMECMMDCATFETNGQTGDTMGFTIQCKMTYMQRAANNPDECLNVIEMCMPL